MAIFMDPIVSAPAPCQFSLLAVRSFIDDGLTLAVALVDRSGPGVEERCAETIERDVPKVPAP